MPKTVVIADDSSFLSRQIADFFTQTMKLDVVGIAKDGNEAVALFAKYKPDLITLDLTMPNKDGKTALAEIMASNPEARVLVVSAVKGNTMLECMKLGAKGYVEKPLKLADPIFIEEFKCSIDEVLNS